MSDSISKHPLVLFGLTDLMHPCWAPIYPAGMPEDWRLTWYGHEYTAALVPEHLWPIETNWPAWAEETQEGFRCYLACSVLDNARLKALATAQSGLGKKLGGLICQQPLSDADQEGLRALGVNWLDPGTGWSRDVDELAACRTWIVESENQPQPPLVSKLQFLPNLQPNSPAIRQKYGEKCAAAVDLQPTTSKSDRLLAQSSCLGLILSGQASPNLRRMRTALDGLHQGSQSPPSGLLLLEPGPAALHNLETCHNLMVLMGLA